jgi:hypothetical protein
MWQTISLARRSPSVAISTSGGRVYVATNLDHVVVSQCATACLTPGNWQSVSVDSARGGGYVVLASDSAGHAEVASTSTWLQLTHLKQ